MRHVAEQRWTDSVHTTGRTDIIHPIAAPEKQLETGDDFAAANAVSPIVQLHDRRHHRQAQAVGVCRVFAGFVGAIEALEQSGRCVRRGWDLSGSVPATYLSQRRATEVSQWRQSSPILCEYRRLISYHQCNSCPGPGNPARACDPDGRGKSAARGRCRILA